MTINEIEEIEQRAERATPGPWYWRVGKHTEDKKTSDAGGLHTRTPIESFTPDGRRFDNDNVIFPAGKVGGEPYWLERFQKENDEDKHFISSAREDVPALIV